MRQKLLASAAIILGATIAMPAAADITVTGTIDAGTVDAALRSAVWPVVVVLGDRIESIRPVFFALRG